MVEALDVIEALWADEPATVRRRALRGQRPRRPAEAGAATSPAAAHRRRRPAGAVDRRRAGPTSSASTSTSPRASSTPTPGPTAPPSAPTRSSAWVRDAAGDRFDDIELQVRVHLVVVTDDRAGMADALAGGFGLAPDGGAGVAPRAGRHGRRDLRRPRRPPRALGHQLHRRQPRRHGRHGAGRRPPHGHLSSSSPSTLSGSSAVPPTGPNTPLGADDAGVGVDVEQRADRVREPQVDLAAAGGRPATTRGPASSGAAIVMVSVTVGTSAVNDERTMSTVRPRAVLGGDGQLGA